MAENSDSFSLDGRTFVGVKNDGGEVDEATRLHFQQDDEVVTVTYTGGSIVQGYAVGTLDGDTWDIRYTQLTRDGETQTGHSVGELSHLPDGRIRVEDEWEWESKEGDGSSVMEEVREREH